MRMLVLRMRNLGVHRLGFRRLMHSLGRGSAAIVAIIVVLVRVVRVACVG